MEERAERGRVRGCGDEATALSELSHDDAPGVGHLSRGLHAQRHDRDGRSAAERSAAPAAAIGRQRRRAGGAGAADPTGAPDAARGRADARDAAPGADADARACTRACTRADGDARACARRGAVTRARRGAVTRARRGGGAGLDDSGASAARGARAGGVPRARSPSGDAVSTGLAHRGRGDAAARGAIAERASGGHTLDRSALNYLRTGADRSARSVRARDAARSVKA